MYNCENAIKYALKNASGDEMTKTEDINALGQYREKFIEAMDDDFNTADGISAIFEMIRAINTLVAENLSKADLEAIYDIYRELVGLMGFLVPEEEGDSAWIDELIEERLQAKKAKNYARADEIREELKAKGIVLEDTPNGTKWKRA
jgi:cysteinyl-tRNA synthetase